MLIDKNQRGTGTGFDLARYDVPEHVRIKVVQMLQEARTVAERIDIAARFCKVISSFDKYATVSDIEMSRAIFNADSLLQSMRKIADEMRQMPNGKVSWIADMYKIIDSYGNKVVRSLSAKFASDGIASHLVSFGLVGDFEEASSKLRNSMMLTLVCDVNDRIYEAVSKRKNRPDVRSRLGDAMLDFGSYMGVITNKLVSTGHLQRNQSHMRVEDTIDRLKGKYNALGKAEKEADTVRNSPIRLARIGDDSDVEVLEESLNQKKLELESAENKLKAIHKMLDTEVLTTGLRRVIARARSPSLTMLVDNPSSIDSYEKLEGVMDAAGAIALSITVRTAKEKFNLRDAYEESQALLGINKLRGLNLSVFTEMKSLMDSMNLINIELSDLEESIKKKVGMVEQQKQKLLNSQTEVDRIADECSALELEVSELFKHVYGVDLVLDIRAEL